jgi:hypothetical protein
MPFDVAVETPKLRQAILIDALRNDKNWKWDYCRTAGCAIGMAQHLWPGLDLQPLPILGTDTVPCSEAYVAAANFFGISKYDAFMIFGSAYRYPVRSMWQVTPEMVADALEKCTAI